MSRMNRMSRMSNMRMSNLINNAVTSTFHVSSALQLCLNKHVTAVNSATPPNAIKIESRGIP